MIYLFLICSFFQDVLPIVEFELEDGISDEEAVHLIKKQPEHKGRRISRQDDDIPASSNWQEENYSEFQTLKFTDFDEKKAVGSPASQSSGKDPFTLRMTTFEEKGQEYTAIVVNRTILEHMPSSEVFIANYAGPIRKRYYRNLVSDMSIVKCPDCHKFFHSDEYEVFILREGVCPFCRSSAGQNPLG